MSLPSCPKCQSDFVYQDQTLLFCPECAYEWDPDAILLNDVISVKDANGTLLCEGDKVTVVKDLKIKGSSQVIKIGSKAVIRWIKDAKDHQLDCKVDGVGEMIVTAKFVKKA